MWGQNVRGQAVTSSHKKSTDASDWMLQAL